MYSTEYSIAQAYIWICFKYSKNMGLLSLDGPRHWSEKYWKRGKTKKGTNSQHHFHSETLMCIIDHNSPRLKQFSFPWLQQLSGGRESNLLTFFLRYTCVYRHIHSIVTSKLFYIPPQRYQRKCVCVVFNGSVCCLHACWQATGSPAFSL